jgi:FkbM family methyltransferase
VRRKLPRDLGGRSLYVSPDAALRFWLPGGEHMDPLLFKLVRQFVKPGAVVWDIGANVGLFSFAAAALAGESGSVLAIEPDPWLASLMNRTAGGCMPGHASVSVLSVAVSDCLGVNQLHIAKRGRASNFMVGMGRSETGGDRQAVSVPTVTLDWIAGSFPPPTLIKIDVEGMEHLVLAGAQGILTHQPIVLAEVAEENKSDVRKVLSTYRFFMTDMSPAAGIPNNLVALPAADAG